MKIIVKNKIRPEVQIFYESLFLLYVEKYNLIIRNGKILTIMCSVNLVFKLKKYIWFGFQETMALSLDCDELKNYWIDNHYEKGTKQQSIVK